MRISRAYACADKLFTASSSQSSGHYLRLPFCRHRVFLPLRSQTVKKLIADDKIFADCPRVLPNTTLVVLFVHYACRHESEEALSEAGVGPSVHPSVSPLAQNRCGIQRLVWLHDTRSDQDVFQVEELTSSISRKLSEIGPWLLLNVNRKS